MEIVLFVDWLQREHGGTARQFHLHTRGLSALAAASVPTQLWTGGSESDVFNALEHIADNVEPRTPVLGCPLSEPVRASAHINSTENDTMPSSYAAAVARSRINWVVQSSAVDFLHLLLVYMRWLCDQWHLKDTNFVISVHDEVRKVQPFYALT